MEAHLKFYRDTDVDFLKISSDGYFGWPAKVLEDLQDTAALYEIEHISPDSPFMREQVERAKKIVERLDGECITISCTVCRMRRRPVLR